MPAGARALCALPPIPALADEGAQGSASQRPNALALETPYEALALCSKRGTQGIGVPETLRVTGHCGLSEAAGSRMRAIWPFGGGRMKLESKSFLLDASQCPPHGYTCRASVTEPVPSCSPRPTPAGVQASGQVGFRGFRSRLRTWWALKASEEVALVRGVKALRRVSGGGTDVTADRPLYTPGFPH